eukprot:TRINITY_DN7409_c0_g3_i1.p1 TRINITY_DN7409_c0_g3~~TRINITY_DN7409_c0_g3_i1.p1  ORF type:complete len:652 (+),score=312.38 TRINITY_DN7409_c0_g3_i1:80-2035(+)
MTSRTTSSTSREQWKKEQQLLEAQRAGEAPPTMDEDGNAINPHIPEYMVNTPWYIDSGGSKTLKHQRRVADKDKKDGIDQWYSRGEFQSAAATKFRKGACQNCGAMTHKKKDCVERPRKVGAKFTGKDIRPDEMVRDVNLSFEGKRDRWNGVVLDDVQAEVIEKHELIEMKRAHVVAQKTRMRIMKHYGVTEGDLRDAEKTIQTRAPQLAAPGTTPAPAPPITRDNILEHKKHVADTVESLKSAGSEKAAVALDSSLQKLLQLIPASQGGLADDETVAEIFEAEDRGLEDTGEEVREELVTKVNTGGVRDGVEARLTARKMRIREDTAKYLRTLSTDPQFYYDAKTRSMRANPYPDKNPDEVDYAGDNWARQTGEAPLVDKMQLFCWDATQRLQQAGHGAKYVNMTANPTQAEMAFKRDQETKKTLQEEKENALVKQYGGTEHLQSMPDELRFASESFVEYRPDGKLLKGVEEAVPLSKYPEDVHRNGHSSVWGSFWQAGSWGFSCCKSTVRNSLCVANSEAQQTPGEVSEEDLQAMADHKRMEEELAALESEMVAASSEKTDAEKEKEKRVRDGLANKEKERLNKKRQALIEEVEATGRRLDVGELQLMGDGLNITAEHIEKYKRRRINPDDPMAQALEEGAEAEGCAKQ